MKAWEWLLSAMIVIGLIVLVCGIVVGFQRIDAYREACRAAGGVVVGGRGPLACIRADAVINLRRKP